MPRRGQILALILGLVGCAEPAPPPPPPPPTIPESPLAVVVSPHPEANPHLGAVVVHFTNTSPAPLWILKPIDGSLGRRHMPHYRFSLADPDHQPVRMTPGCNEWGLWSGTRWPVDYLVKIDPGMSHDETFHLARYFACRRSEVYTISFEYVYLAEGRQRFAVPPEAWRGSVKAPEVVIPVEAK